MSAPLPFVDLTGAIIGTQKSLDFSPFVKVNPANPMEDHAHLALFNESGCGLQLAMRSSGNGQYLPAGGWTTFEIQQNDSSLAITVTYTLPNPPVSQLNVVYFAPGETLPGSYTLGNSPIGIGGTVNTSNVQTLSNEGGAANTLVIDMGDAAFNQLYTLYNDGHSLWAVDQAGTKHQVVKVQTSGNPLQLGQSGDTVEQLGNEKVDGNLTVVGTSSLDNANLTTDGAGNLSFAANSKAINMKDSAGNNIQAMAFDGSTAQKLNMMNSAFGSKLLDIFSNTQIENNLTVLGSLIPNQGAASTQNGTSGTVSFYTPIWGSAGKILLIVFNGFADNVSGHTFSFPSNISWGFWANGNLGVGRIQFKSGGVAQTLSQISALSSTNGSSVGVTNAGSNAIGQLVSSVDSVFITTSAQGASSSIFVLVGV